MTGRARNVVIANNDFATKAATVLTSPTSFVAGMGLSNILNDRLKMVCRTIGSSVILDLDMGYPVPISLIMLLGHNFTAAARWRIRGARARSGAASDAGGYSFALSDTVYDTRSILVSGTARGGYSWTSTMLDHDLTSGTLPTGASFSRASTATYFDFTGTMRTAASGEARFDYDPVTKTARGLLIEAARTNLVTQSADFSTGWGATLLNITAGSGAAPDGSNAANKLTATAVNGQHAVARNITAAPNAAYSFSCFVKADGYSVVSLLMDKDAAFVDRLTAEFNVSTGTITSAAAASGSASGASASIISVGNGWYRCTIGGTLSSTAGTSVRCIVYVNGQASYTGDNTSGLLAWGTQLEAGSFPTSYIPTAGTTATRAADVPTMPTSALPSFNGSAGTLVVASSQYVAGSSTGQLVAAEIGDGTNNNVIQVGTQFGSANFQYLVQSGGVAQAVLLETSFTGEQRRAASWAQDNFAYSRNGASPLTDTSGAVPTVTTFSMGCRPSGTDQLNGWISRITYIASRVSNADLQTLTNPATSAATRAATLAVYAGTEAVQPITLGTGSKTVYVDDQNMRFYAGARVRLSIDSSNYIVGTVTSYDRPSRRLVVSIASVVGSGSAAAVTISREAADLAVWPAVEPFGLTYWGDFRWGGQIDLLGEGYQPPGVHMPGLANGDGQPIYARYLKIEVQDSSLSWLDIGRLVVAAAYQPTINMTWDWRIGWTDPSQRERARGGQIYVDGRKQWRVASLQLANVGRDELLSQVYELRRAVGVRKPFALILDPTDPANLHRLTLWGSIPDQTMDFSNPQFGDYRAALTVEEHS
ncbi:hypothetical protein IP70_15625 [alpha proteobacterium AAP38]|nr:hypothetical protein IP70_15625 [alpha proteobacterium AAP38]